MDEFLDIEKMKLRLRSYRESMIPPSFERLLEGVLEARKALGGHVLQLKGQYELMESLQNTQSDRDLQRYIHTTLEPDQTLLVHLALDAVSRHLDVASQYGDSEDDDEIVCEIRCDPSALRMLRTGLRIVREQGKGR